jgi:NAD(P)H-nitrite reductase large subunit
MEFRHDYIIVGSGLAGTSAIEGIRERDQTGSVLLLAREPHSPYDRPPLSKQLWFGKSHDGHRWRIGAREIAVVG